MKVNDIYTKSKAFMFEKKSSTNNDDYIIDILNKVLVETFEENNMLRMFRDKLPLTEIPQVSKLDDEVAYEDVFLLEILPKGITANFLMDDDMTKMDIYEREYNNARVMRQVLVPQSKVEKLTQEALNANNSI